jgi:tetratricopeptide (TPR) repeat protein
VSAAPSADFPEALQAFQRGDLARARELAEKAVERDSSPAWQHMLGLIHCRLGNPAEGVRHLQAAAEAEPANTGFQVMLARALVDSGRAREVLAMPEPPPITSPATMALWQVRGEAGEAAGDRAAASICWGRIATASPTDWRALANLGNALAAQGRWVDAAEALSESSRLNPSEPAVRTAASAALIEAGRAYQGQLRFDEAEQAYRRAYELDPADPATVHLLGVALERTNRLDALAKLVAEATAAGVAGERLNYLRALIARREGDLESAHALLLASDPKDEPLRWHALHAKIADALGNSAEAFDAAVAMNQAAVEQAVGSSGREEWNRKAASYRADLHDLARMITREWASTVPRLEDPVLRRLTFLLGFPRSGTTLLDTFLMGHPEVEVLEEKQLVGRAADVIGGSIGLPDASMKLLRKARKTYFDALAEHVADDFAGLVVDKFPLDMAAAPVIEALFPRSPLIFAQRHPCDVVLSGFMQPIGVVNFSSIEDAADYYDAMMSIWTAARQALDLNVHTVVYEEMVRDPEAVLRPLVKFLGLDWDDRILDHRRTAKERGTIATPTYDQVTEPISTRPSGRWKRYAKQMEPALPVLLPWAERLGYSD